MRALINILVKCIQGLGGDTEELFIGKKDIKEESSLVCLGHVLLKGGGNLENIIDKSIKSIGTQKQILKMVKGL